MIKTPLRYAGGKSKAIKILSPYIQSNKVISPFIGGGSLEVYLAATGKEVIGFDIFEPLVIFWKVLLSRPIELYDRLLEISPTKENYAEVKEILMQWDITQELLKDWKTDTYKRNPISLSDLDAAAYYFFNHNCSYGPGYLGWASEIYMNEKSWMKMLNGIKKFHLPNLSVNLGNFEDIIPQYNTEFLYLDPPYYLSNDKSNKMFAGIYPQRNIPVHHNTFQHELLNKLVKNHNGKFVLSYNDCSEVRDLYSDYFFEFPSWHYSMGNGEVRIGKNRKQNNTKNSKDSHEILIHNFKKNEKFSEFFG